MTVSGEPRSITSRSGEDGRPSPVSSADRRGHTDASDHCPVVGIGCSAGGLEALTTLLDATPADIGMAFVVIQHLDPKHRSLMSELLQAHSILRVSVIEDGAEVRMNHVHVIPPGCFLTIEDRHFHLSRFPPRQGVRMTIDVFFRSLALDQREKSICIVLSGTGTDGTHGLKAVKEVGGLVIVEDPKEAAQDGMPRSAIETGVVDFVLPLDEIPRTLRQCVDKPCYAARSGGASTEQEIEALLPSVIAVLKERAPVDFRLYRHGTLVRRLERRMGLNDIDSPSRYLEHLRENLDEADALTNDLLISVTHFFRDRAMFETLEKTVIPRILDAGPSEEPVRVWVAGCATGEEAYSIAMLLIERMSREQPRRRIQLFASDVSESALDIARTGEYPDSIAADVDPERLTRFFTKVEHRYTATAELRETITFARQDLLRDPPFSNLELIACRNVLIYLEPAVQSRLIEMFHFALRSKGVLMLGTSETVGTDNDDLFRPLGAKHRLFERADGLRQKRFQLPAARSAPFLAGAVPRPLQGIHPPGLAEITGRLLLEHHMPAAVLINAKSECLYLLGPIDRYLRVPVGKASRQLLAMVRDGLRADLRTAIAEAIRSAAVATTHDALVDWQDGRGRRPVSISVRPVDGQPPSLLLVTFSDEAVPGHASTSDAAPVDSALVAALEGELDRTREELRHTIGEHERASEDLRAANEEAMSMNEEFQSTNEELETSKEELQSLNEELTTLNNQLQHKIAEQRVTAADLDNLLVNAEIAIVFLDRDLRIKRFTRPVMRLFALRTSDKGRSLSDITRKIDDTELARDAAEVLRNGSTSTREVRGEDGAWYNRRIRPYRMDGARFDDVVVTFAEISELKGAEARTRREKAHADNIVDTVREPLLILDAGLRVASANRAFHQVFRTTPVDTVGVALTELAGGQWNVPELLGLLEQVIRDDVPVESFEIDREFREVGRRVLVLNARRLQGENEKDHYLLLAFHDATERQLALEALREREARLSSIVQLVPDAIITIDRSGVMTSFSPAAERMFGHAAESTVGRNVAMLLPEADRAAHTRSLAEYAESGVSRIIGHPREVTALKGDGTTFPAHLSVDETVQDGRNVLVGVVRDLTLEKRQQEELHQAQKMEAMGQLAGGVAHDFNNLLTVILGNLDRIAMKSEDESLHSMIEDASEAARLGAKLTGQMLAFGHRQAVNPVTFILDDLIREVEGILCHGVGEHTPVRITLSRRPWKVHLDKGLMVSAMLNLCLNARDAMPQGGQLVIETENTTLEADPTLSSVEIIAGDFVRLTVSDTGVGMSSEERSRSIEPFFTTKNRGEGSGLGLSMVYGFVRQSGGFVRIESEPDEGTAVSLLLPRAPRARPRGQEGSDAAEGVEPRGSEIVLVVEDDERVRRLTTERLRDLGYTILEAGNGPEAIERLKSTESIELLFTDVIMPGGMDGAQLVEEARRLCPSIRVLYTSGFADDILHLEQRDALLRKPYDSDQLARKLREVLQE